MRGKKRIIRTRQQLPSAPAVANVSNACIPDAQLYTAITAAKAVVIGDILRQHRLAALDTLPSVSSFHVTNITACNNRFVKINAMHPSGVTVDFSITVEGYNNLVTKGDFDVGCIVEINDWRVLEPGEVPVNPNEVDGLTLAIALDHDLDVVLEDILNNPYYGDDDDGSKSI